MFTILASLRCGVAIQEQHQKNKEALHFPLHASVQPMWTGLQPVEKTGERGRTRTCDPCLKRALLYQLSYAPTIFKCNTRSARSPFSSAVPRQRAFYILQ